MWAGGGPRDFTRSRALCLRPERRMALNASAKRATHTTGVSAQSVSRTLCGGTYTASPPFARPSLTPPGRDGGPCSRLCGGGAGAEAKRRARGHPPAGSGERDPPARARRGHTAPATTPAGGHTSRRPHCIGGHTNRAELTAHFQQQRRHHLRVHMAGALGHPDARRVEVLIAREPHLHAVRARTLVRRHA